MKKLIFLAAGAMLLSGCDCGEAADSWNRHLGVSVVHLDMEEVAAGELEVRDGWGNVRFACSVRFGLDEEGELDAIEEDCAEDVLGTTYYEPYQEWLTSFHVEDTFSRGSLWVRLTDADGGVVEEWTEDVNLRWDHDLSGLACGGGVYGDITVDPQGRPVQLP